MKVKIRLGDADRARLDCPEWMDLDLDHMSVAEAETLEETGGDWSIIGGTGAKPAKTRVWLALYRAGVNVSFQDLDFNLVQVEAEIVDPGKAEGSTGADSSTPPTSASSTRRSRPRRSKTST